MIYRVRSLSKYALLFPDPDVIHHLICFLVDNNLYAMKEITFEDSTSMQTALQEKQLMSRFSHKHVCKYVDSFVANNNKLYLIMEYCDKGDLEQYLQRLKAMGA